MKIEHAIFPIALAAFLISGCTSASKKEYTVRDAASAIRIGLDACISKKVVQPSPSDMHAELRGGAWHVWEQGEKCQVFSTDVDAFTGIAGDCSVCVS